MDGRNIDRREALIRERYRDPSVPVPEEWNPVLETVIGHRSVRGFLAEPVSDATLGMIMAAASSAATSSNLQTWSVVAVRDQARRDRLRVHCANQAHISEAPLFLVWLADLARLRTIAARRGADVQGLDHMEMLFIGIVDAALAAQNAVVALESLGLGSVYIGGIRNHPEKVAAELGLPPEVFPVFGLCVGRPDPGRPTAIKPRLPPQVVLHREQYGAVDEAEVAAFDGRMSDFQAEQGMPDEVWSRRCIARTRNAASLTGRHRIRAALANLGFGLK